MFIDKTFPPDESSLTWADDPEDSDPVWFFRHLSKGWKRISDFSSEQQPRLWGDRGPRPSDIVEGNLGISWIHGPLSALAEWPDRIQTLIQSSETSPNGIYKVYFYIMNEKRSVVVDDFVPFYVTEDGLEVPINSIANQGVNASSNWAILLEKAMAKLYVNYANLNNGTQEESLRALTGMPVHTFFNDEHSDEAMFALIEQGGKNGWVMTASSLHPQDGIQAMHVYTVLGTLTLNRTSPFEREEKVIKLRSTWGSENFDGPWSDEAKEWDQELMLQAGHEVKDDGIFFI